MLAGATGLITRAFPAANAARNPATEYEIAPKELFHLTRQIRAAGLQLLGIYHSHPNGKNEPSPRDMPGLTTLTSLTSLFRRWQMP